MAASEALATFAASYVAGEGVEVHAAKRLILDTVGVALAAADAAGVPELRLQAEAQGGAPEAPIWGCSSMIPAAEATFVNGTAAAALDFDAVHEGSILHADAVVAPACMAMASKVHATGRQLLSAYIVGVEVAHRLSLATPRRGGWFGSSTAGVFGAAAASAKLLGLGAAGIGDALGIALSLSSGTKQAIVERTLTKRLQTAFAARSGIHAAQAVLAGIHGPADWLEGEFGWFKLYEGGQPARVTENLGRQFDLVSTGMKKYPSCLCNHAVIDAADRLMRNHNLSVPEISEIEVVISPYMKRIVGSEFDPSGDAQVAAQFSVQYAAACAVEHGEVTLDDIDPSKVRDSAMARRARLVRVSTDPSWPGQVSPGAVRLTRNDGSRFELRVDELPGSARRPLSDDEVWTKAVTCMTRGRAALAKSSADELARRIMALDELEDVHTLFSGLEGSC